MDNFGLYVILTRPAVGHVVAAEAAVRCGVRMLQLGEKNLPDGELLRIAREVRAVTRGTETRFIVNDRPDIALLSDADGVHVGQGVAAEGAVPQLHGHHPAAVHREADHLLLLEAVHHSGVAHPVLPPDAGENGQPPQQRQQHQQHDPTFHDQCDPGRFPQLSHQRFSVAVPLGINGAPRGT